MCIKDRFDLSDTYELEKRDFFKIWLNIRVKSKRTINFSRLI
jgi:hypothetical protein